MLKSHKSKVGVMYMQLWKQCALPVITTMALRQLMHLGTWCTATYCWIPGEAEWKEIIKYICCYSCRSCNALPIAKNRWRNIIVIVFTFHRYNRFNAFTGFPYIFNIFLEVSRISVLFKVLKKSCQYVSTVFKLQMKILF